MSGFVRAAGRASLCAILLGLSAPSTLAQTAPGAAPPAPLPTLREVVIEGATAFGRPEIVWLLRLREGQPLPEPAPDLASALRARYAADGFVCARVDAAFDAGDGRLTLRVDEGRLDDIEFAGVDAAVADRMRADVAVRPGDVYNRQRVDRALDALLEPTGGAWRASVGDGRAARRSPPSGPPADSCALVERDGRRVLVISLRQEAGRFSTLLGTGEREDWYSPVDGFAPALGFRATIFDHRRFNHTFLTGYVGYKFARDKAGYTFGIERPLARTPRISIGADIHDLTATDDDWRVSTVEQSLAAFALNDSFRDYYERRGYQVHAAVRFTRAQEAVLAWRDDRHEALANETDFSLFRDGRSFPENTPIAAGRLRALVAGYTFDSRTLADDAEAAFARHLIDGFYGRRAGDEPGVRVDWTSEVAANAFGGNFDFSRHVLDARAYTHPSPRQTLNGRLILGLGDGALPPQRLFALGGIGSVHGYGFKTVAGERMALFNADYQVSLAQAGSRRASGGLRGLAFVDAGRIWRPIDPRKGWLVGAGVGVALGDLRVDFGWPLNDAPRRLQVLVRLGRSF